MHAARPFAAPPKLWECYAASEAIMRLSDRRVAAAAQFHQTDCTDNLTLFRASWTSGITAMSFWTNVLVLISVRWNLCSCHSDPILPLGLILPNSPNNRTCLSEPPKPPRCLQVLLVSRRSSTSPSTKRAWWALYFLLSRSRCMDQFFGCLA